MTRDVVQVLEPDGSALVSPAPDVSNTERLELYRVMAIARRLDERLVERHAAGRLEFHVTSRGTEAVAVGAAAALEPADVVFPSVRCPAMALVRGVSTARLAHGLASTGRATGRGRATPGHWSFRDAGLLSFSSPGASRLLHAVGAAYAFRLQERPSVAVAWCGSHAVGGADFLAALESATALSAPVVLICATHRATHAIELARLAGVATGRVDGDDVLAVLATTAEAAARARDGGGPALVEAVIGHAERSFEPVERLRGHLLATAVLTPDLDREILAAVAREVDEAIEELDSCEPPSLASAFEDVWSKPPEAWRRRRDAFLRFGAEYGGQDDADASFASS